LPAGGSAKIEDKIGVLFIIVVEDDVAEVKLTGLRGGGRTGVKVPNCCTTTWFRSMDHRVRLSELCRGWRCITMASEAADGLKDGDTEGLTSSIVRAAAGEDKLESKK
jgi:hypothetical protein